MVLIGSVPGVPGPAPKRLTPAEIREYRSAVLHITRAEREWAKVVRRLQIAAVARHLGVTPQALHARIRRIEQAHG